MADAQPKQPDHPGDRGSAQPPKRASAEPSAEMQTWFRKCKARWPVAGKEHQGRVRREVLDPFSAGQIGRAEAERIWESIWKESQTTEPILPGDQVQAADERPPAAPGKAQQAASPETTAHMEPSGAEPSEETHVTQADRAPAGQTAGPELPPGGEASDVAAAGPPAAPADEPASARQVQESEQAARAEEAEPVPDGEPGEGEGGQAVEAAPDEEGPEGDGEPAPPPKPEWRVLEPEDKSDPVEHESWSLKQRDKHWNILAASVRGKLHAHHAKWREDAFAFDWVDNWTMIALADGAGSARFSRIGARLACDAAVGALKELLSGYQVRDKRGDAPSDATLKQLKAFLVLAACEARDAVVREAFNRGVSEKELYSTLLLLIHSPWRRKDLVGAVQVGDGAIGLYTGNGKCTLLGAADHGEWSSETVFLTSWRELAKKPFDHRVLFSVKEGVQCIAAMCDGVSDDFFPEEKRLIELFEGDPIQEMTTKSGEPVKGVLHEVLKDPGRDGEALGTWLRYEKRGSSDDRTLIIMYRSDV